MVGDWLFNLFRNVMAGHLCGGSCTCTSVLNGCSQYYMFCRTSFLAIKHTITFLTIF